MEPFKALTLVVAAAIGSLVLAGAVGFYAGYSAGRGNLAEIRTYLAEAPVSVAGGPGGEPVSLKPVADEIRALSARIETLATAQPRAAAAAPVDASIATKPVLDEIRGLGRQLEALKSDVAKVQTVAAARASVNTLERPALQPAHDYTDTLTDIREQVRGLALKMDKQEPKAPKALVDEIRSVGAAVQAQDVGTRKVVEEVRTGFASLQNAEPKAPKALLDEVRTISANVSAQAAKPQVSVVDQIKILQASVESLKTRIAESQGHGGAADGADLAQIRQLLLAATDQFGKCQTQLASYSAPAPVAQTVSAPAAAISVSPSTRQEPAAVVFYDNVMLKKDQEKQYDEIGVRLALQAIGPKQVRVAVNRQGFGLAFGERKVFRSQDVECELNLMETNLNDAQARVSLSCKR